MSYSSKFHYSNIKSQSPICFLSSISLSPLPPPLPPLAVLLLTPGRTIKSFPGLSHPMSRMMRICSLNQNSHLLYPSLFVLLFLALLIIFSHSFIASFIFFFPYLLYFSVIFFFLCQFFNNFVFFLQLSLVFFD